MTTILLTLVYPLLLIARLFDAMAGRDPLRRRHPRDVSLWIVRAPSATDASYFSEASPAETTRPRSARLPEVLLLWIAGFYAPPRRRPGEKFSAGADREQGIPDEMYTLW